MCSQSPTAEKNPAQNVNSAEAGKAHLHVRDVTGVASLCILPSREQSIPEEQTTSKLVELKFQG